MNPFDEHFYQSVRSIPFGIATTSPVLIAAATFAFSKGLPLLWRSFLVIAATALSLPVGFVLVMMSLDMFSTSGGTAGRGVAAVPMLLVWAATAAGSILTLIGMAVLRTRRR